MSQPQSAPPEVISRPDQADVSPNFDFTKISGVGVFPAFPSAEEVPAFSDAFSSAFAGALQTRQNQWKIINAKDLVERINSAGIGQGYKNLQADVNTFSQGAQVRVLTKTTQEFLERLGKSLGVNAFLLSSYEVRSLRLTRIVQPSIGAAILGAQPQPEQYTEYDCTIFVSLYKVGENFIWTAKHTVKSETTDFHAEELAKVLAGYVGKGTLRQL
jgi:hypothetical protein